LRNALFTAWPILHEYASYHVAYNFYREVRGWREWARARKLQTPDIDLEERFPSVVAYQEQLREYGYQVIKVLQESLEATPLRFEIPALTELPGKPATPNREPNHAAIGHSRHSRS